MNSYIAASAAAIRLMPITTPPEMISPTSTLW